MTIQNTAVPTYCVPTTAAMAAMIAPGATLQVGSLCFVTATNLYYSYQPGQIAQADSYHIAATVGGYWQVLEFCGNPDASFRGFVEMPYGDASLAGTGLILTTATINTHRFICSNGGLVSNVVMASTTTGATLTAATTLTASAAAAGTGGVVQLTTGSTASFATGDIVVVTALVGTTEGNGTWQITVVDGTHVSLNGSVFVNAYVSGGTVTRSVNTVALYSGSGVWLGASVDQVGSSTLWTGTAGIQTMAVANTANPSLLTLNQGAAYYMVLVTKGTTPPIFAGMSATTAAIANIGLTTSNIRWGTLSTSATKLTSTIVPANIVTTDAVPNWFALS